ncbi:MAG: hypothetical protein BIFFINMI_01308 [Phycisphaerae bacterium]|nr:hypothetical protein [Phycisphaerae bacterium]
MKGFSPIGCVLLLLTSVAMADQPAPPPDAPTSQPAVTDEQRAFVARTLRQLDPANMNADAAAADLVAGGKVMLPAMREAADQPDKLVGDDELKSDTYRSRTGGMVQIAGDRSIRVQMITRVRIAALNKAIVRLDWGFEPAEVIEKWAADQKDNAGRPCKVIGRTWRVEEPALEALFPDRLFCANLVPMYPVARMVPPGPLKDHNIFILDRKGQVRHETDVEGLKAFFRENLPAIRQPGKDDANAKAAVRAWLALGEVLVSDGMFQFSLDETSLQVQTDRPGEEAARITAADGRAQAEGGGNQGFVSVELKFDAAGRLADAVQQARLRAGIRPICQATKLLDPDPIVRKMAEQDLLLMGSAARDYIFEQRTKATPELQAAIDAVWGRILQREAEWGR